MLLKPNDISEIVGFGGNIDVDQLKPSINVAQSTYLKRILGQGLFDKIYNDYSTNTLTDAYKVIYDDYVVYILAFYSASVYLSINTNKTTNAGTYKVGVEGSTSAPLNEVAIIGKNYEAIAISYEQSFYQYISKNPVPEYTQDNNKKQNLTNLLGWY
ncbi:hypothetical protein GKZ90_0021095 [Flavobacterium sp. MC2016-06]|nr:hypothetical protein [Flavobacterium sp. MC2016-06]MBU3860998.1 hypothetical protein [Flavobacterium sp. MC2016-06]